MSPFFWAIALACIVISFCSNPRKGNPTPNGIWHTRSRYSLVSAFLKYAQLVSCILMNETCYVAHLETSHCKIDLLHQILSPPVTYFSAHIEKNWNVSFHCTVSNPYLLHSDSWPLEWINETIVLTFCQKSWLILYLFPWSNNFFYPTPHLVHSWIHLSQTIRRPIS